MSVLPPSDRDRPTVNRITGPGDMSAVDAGVTLYAHGGGFEQRNPGFEQVMACRLSAATGRAAWALDYRLAPANPWWPSRRQCKQPHQVRGYARHEPDFPAQPHRFLQPLTCRVQPACGGTIRLMLDFDAYIRRIGLDPADKPTWQAVHRAHATKIPFENLDSHRGIPISLEQADLERKLVASRRGGYCFEHNLLLASALEHMGLGVEPMLARVRADGASRQTRPASHLVLRVTDRDGRQWHADVGFGLGTLLDPVPFGPAGVHEQSGWSFQVVEDGDELVLRTLGPDGWADVYSFPPHPAFRIDIEVSNWWVCTHPSSPFVSRLIVAVSHDDGRREALHDFSGSLLALASSPDGTEVTEVEREAIPSLLARRFGLPGFGLRPDGRVVALS